MKKFLFLPLIFMFFGFVSQVQALIEIQNDFIKVIGDQESGRYVIKSTGGDPDLDTDQNKLLLYEEYPPTSFATIRIDKRDYKFGGEQGFFSVPMQVRQNKIITTWSINNIDITLFIQFTLGPNTGRMDSVRIAYVVINKDFVPHNIGVRIMLDTFLGKNDGSPFRIPGIGPITTETVFEGDNIPKYWYAFDNLGEPSVRAQGTLRGKGMTKPDKVIFASWERFNKYLWDFKTIEGRSFRRAIVGPLDSATACYWNPVTVQPNKQIGASIIYGLYGATLVKGDAFNISLGGEIETKGNPVIVSADIAKNAKFPAKDVVTSILLPKGLVLKKGETNEQQIGTLYSNTTVVRKQWTLIPDGTALGEVEYTVSVKGMIEGKEYENKASRKLKITEAPKKPKEPEKPKVPEKPQTVVSTLYQFDFSEINSILEDINKTSQKNNSLLKKLNQLLQAKNKFFSKKDKADYKKNIKEIQKTTPAYSEKIRNSGKNIIKSSTTTNVQKIETNSSTNESKNSPQ